MPRRRRNIPLYVMVSPEELEQLHARMDEAGVRNMSAFVRKMALNANTYGVYPDEIAGLQQDYAELWGRMNDILKQLATIITL